LAALFGEPHKVVQVTSTMNKPTLAVAALLALSLACALTPGGAPPKPSATLPQAAVASPTAPAASTVGPANTAIAGLPATAGAMATAAPTAGPTGKPPATLPPVAGEEPSARVAAFYYPWYGNPLVDGAWVHWNQNGWQPPQDIGSDYYPVLGAYSSNDPAVVVQHMAWLRQAGIGVIISSWWGPGSREDKAVPLLLKMAGRYGLKVTLHIEPFSGRTAQALVEDVKYIEQQYGADPAFFRSSAASRYSPGGQPKPMLFVWAIEVPDTGSSPVPADYWQKALDAIHALPGGALVIGNTLQADWITGAHLDGLYNYITLHLEQQGGFAWARSLPPGALYIPSVMPGNSAQRVGYPPDTLVPRQDGATFAAQWAGALGTGVEPAMITITSFNEWHEGTMIEPAATGVNDGHGYTYADFGALAPEGYLGLARQWVGRFLAATWPATHRARITIRTTSDWTTLNVVDGGAWLRPEQVSTSQGLVHADMEAGGRFLLMQSFQSAEAGQAAEMTWDVQLSGLDPAGTLRLQIDRGNLGATTVMVFNYAGSAPVAVKTFRWGGITTGRNSQMVSVPASALTGP
jgi:glycoprotein endo-alpha-1,2-mannosidase